jgi:hypothetical protein
MRPATERRKLVAMSDALTATWGRPDFYEPLIGWRLWRRREGELFPERPAEARSPAIVPGSAPDYVEPVTAWRVWRIVERRGRFLLASIYVNVAWPSRLPLEAQCHQFTVGWPQPHEAPHEVCTCGIYATPLERVPIATFARRRLFPAAVGPTALWGGVVEGEHGWRASRAYPRRIYVPCLGDRPSADDLRRVDGLAHYGVPVEPLCVASTADVVPRLLELQAGDGRLAA